MTTCKKDDLRDAPQCRPHARSNHAPVAGPLALTLLIQAMVIAACVAVGLPLLMIAGVVLGVAVLTLVASRRTVSSLVAGAGIRLAQPYEPGEQVRVFVPALNSVQDAEIVRVGAANTTLMTASGIVLVPNAQMLRGGTATER